MAFRVTDAVLTLSVVFVARRVENLCPCCTGPIVMAIHVADVDDDAAARRASPARRYETAGFIFPVKPYPPRPCTDFGVDHCPVRRRFDTARLKPQDGH